MLLFCTAAKSQHALYERLGLILYLCQKLGPAVEVLGVRSDESASRQGTTELNGERPAIIDGKNPTVRPIITWTEEDAVQYLKEHKRWGGRSFDYLIDLYGYQINDACTKHVLPCQAGRNGIYFSSLRLLALHGGLAYKMPASPVLESAREKLRQISDDMSNREFVNGKPRKLNQKGRSEVARTLLDALEKEPEAFGYGAKEL